ncbi:MAG: 3-hydroxyacyl-CoA dehydrogenase family protein [Bacteriovorax sp.]|nr:3-hydroxyacyl-CoA dehydrogenase family protein [Bacteriovorax sp.]
MKHNIQSDHNNIMVVAHPDHPLYMELIQHYKVRTIDEAINSFDTYELVIDLSALRTQKKFLFLKELAKTTKADIISDLTLCWGEWILKYSPQVKASVSTLFYSPTNAFEYSLRDSSNLPLEKIIADFATTTNQRMVEHKNLGLCFHYPRTIAMIINEAYFALGDKLASATAIDLAMKNGVNYPLGPIEWGEKIGLHNIAQLLEELSTITRDERYKLSTELKLHAFKYL